MTRWATLGTPVGALAGIALVAAAAPGLAVGGVLHGQPSRDAHLDLSAQLVPMLAPGGRIVTA